MHIFTAAQLRRFNHKIVKQTFISSKKTQPNETMTRVCDSMAGNTQHWKRSDPVHFIQGRAIAWLTETRKDFDQAEGKERRLYMFTTIVQNLDNRSSQTTFLQTETKKGGEILSITANADERERVCFTVEPLPSAVQGPGGSGPVRVRSRCRKPPEGRQRLWPPVTVAASTASIAASTVTTASAVTSSTVTSSVAAVIWKQKWRSALWIHSWAPIAFSHGRMLLASILRSVLALFLCVILILSFTTTVTPKCQHILCENVFRS